MMRPARVVSTQCNNACVFCAQRGAPLSISNDSGEAVILVGGEPSLRDDLADVVAEAHRGGARTITLQTNAARLDKLGALRSAGLTGVQLSLHGSEAAHDYLTGTTGSHLRVVRALREARELDLEVGVVSVVTRSSYRSLHLLPELLGRHRVSSWRLVIPTVAGALSETFDSVFPRLGMVLPRVLHALAAAERLGVPTGLVDAPLCLTGPYADHVIRSESPHAYSERCRQCAARAQCPGVDPAYLARFGGDELRPRDPAKPVSAAFAHLFAGTGTEHRGVEPTGRKALPVVK